MRLKILTVDDSKTVRIIVRKAFKPFDCEILEAANGVEGLAVSAKDSPDLILLDVTMPVMDGIEMLTRLKSDAALRNIPVVMLTAEGGRENVLRIARVGVRDYLVKPFREELLVEKCSRIVDLKPLSDLPARARTVLDPADILVVDDKPAIVQQIQLGLKHTPWIFRSACTQGEAIDACSKSAPDLVIISLSLPEESAFSLHRLIRAGVKTKYTPIFALAVKTEVTQQQRAQAAGFNTIVTKPIDPVELEAKMARAMNLDTSLRYYACEEGVMLLRLPENCSSAAIAEIAGYMKAKFTEAIDAGLNKLVIDIRLLKSLHFGVIKLLYQAMQSSRELGMHFALAGNAQVISECKGFEDTRDWTFYESVDEARRHLGVPGPTVADVAPAG